jgi:hypothetical protein
MWLIFPFFFGCFAYFAGNFFLTCLTSVFSQVRADGIYQNQMVGSGGFCRVATAPRSDLSVNLMLTEH